MTDTDLDNLYKVNLPISHYAGLRGVFDAAYALGANQTSPAPSADVSSSVQEPASTAAADAGSVTQV